MSGNPAYSLPAAMCVSYMGSGTPPANEVKPGELGAAPLGGIYNKAYAWLSFQQGLFSPCSKIKYTVLFSPCQVGT